MTIKMFKAWRGSWKTKAPKNEDNIASTTRATLLEEHNPAPSIAERRRHPSPPALNISSLRPAQPAVVEKTTEKPSTLQRVLSTKRPTIKDLKRLPPIPCKATAQVEDPVSKMPASLEWLDRVEMTGEDRRSLVDDILGAFDCGHVSPRCEEASLVDLRCHGSFLL